MKFVNVHIPCLCPHPLGLVEVCSSYGISQPIIQIKDEKVDQVRYDQWKASLKPKSRKL